MANPEKREVLERQQKRTEQTPSCKTLTRFLLYPATQRGSKSCTTNFNANRALLAARLRLPGMMTREREIYAVAQNNGYCTACVRACVGCECKYKVAARTYTTQSKTTVLAATGDGDCSSEG
jgi:hypothetical protein